MENSQDTKTDTSTDRVLIPMDLIGKILGFQGDLPKPFEKASKDALRRSLPTLLEDARGKIVAVAEPKKGKRKGLPKPIDVVPQSGVPFLTEFQLKTAAKKSTIYPTQELVASAVFEILGFLGSEVYLNNVGDCLKAELAGTETSAIVETAKKSYVRMETSSGGK